MKILKLLVCFVLFWLVMSNTCVGFSSRLPRSADTRRFQKYKRNHHYQIEKQQQQEEEEQEQEQVVLEPPRYNDVPRTRSSHQKQNGNEMGGYPYEDPYDPYEDSKRRVPTGPNPLHHR